MGVASGELEERCRSFELLDLPSTSMDAIGRFDGRSGDRSRRHLVRRLTRDHSRVNRIVNVGGLRSVCNVAPAREAAYAGRVSEIENAFVAGAPGG